LEPHAASNGAWTLGLPAPGAAQPSRASGAWATVVQPVSAAQDEWGSQGAASGARYVTILAGAYSLDDDWEPIDDQGAVGFELDESDPATGEGWEAGVLYAEDDDTFVDTLFGLGSVRVESDTVQIYSGWRQTFRPQQQGYHPYRAAGVAVLWTKLEGSTSIGSVDDDDITPGAYVRAGILWDVGPGSRLGLDYRHLFADDFELFGVDVDSDADVLLLTFGWAF
jgi:hypothetical protein